MVSVEETRDFFGGEAGDQGFDLLPTKESDGAPEDNRYLLKITDAEYIQANSGSRRISYTSEVVEPETFAGRLVWGALFFGGGEEKGTPSQIEKGKAKTRTQVDAVIGERARKALMDSGPMDEALGSLAGALNGAEFIGQIGVQKDKTGQGFPDKNVIRQYFSAGDWSPNGFSAGMHEGLNDLPF